MSYQNTGTEPPPPLASASKEPLVAQFTKRHLANALESDVQLASSNPIVSALLCASNGILWVLNQDRRIVAVNRAWLDYRGSDSQDRVLGLRPGDALHCVHAANAPAGCGTTVACGSCGTALVIIAAHQDLEGHQSECVLRATRGDETTDYTMRVRAQRLQVEDSEFTLLFMDDVSADHRRACVERAFFHDVNNVATAILSTTECLDGCSSEELPDLVNDLRAFAIRLVRELNVQRALSNTRPEHFATNIERVDINELLNQVLQIIARHPSGKAAHVHLRAEPGLFIHTDRSLVERLLSNLLINALEARAEGSTGQPAVAVISSLENSRWVLRVWNPEAIPVEVQPRIFQRYFSTKTGTGRGQGLFSAKLFIEQYLGGVIDFSSDPVAGTTFRLTLPTAAAT